MRNQVENADCLEDGLLVEAQPVPRAQRRARKGGGAGPTHCATRKVDLDVTLDGVVVEIDVGGHDAAVEAVPRAGGAKPSPDDHNSVELEPALGTEIAIDEKQALVFTVRSPAT